MADLDPALSRESGSPLTDLDDDRRRAMSHAHTHSYPASQDEGGELPPGESEHALDTPVRRGGGGTRGRGTPRTPAASGSGSTRKRTASTPSSAVTAARREANRLAAERSRVRQGERAKILETMARGLAEENMALKERVRKLVVMGVVPPEGLEALVRAIVAPPAIGAAGEQGGGSGAGGERGEEINDAEAQALLQHLSQSGRGGAGATHSQAQGQGSAQDDLSGTANSGAGLFPSESVDGLLNLGLGNVGGGGGGSNALSDLAAAAEAAGAGAGAGAGGYTEDVPQDQQDAQEGSEQQRRSNANAPVDAALLDPSFAPADSKTTAAADAAGTPAAPAPTLADPAVLNAPLSKEIEALLQQELEELQARVDALAAAPPPMPPTAATLGTTAGADEHTPNEILILRDMERRMRAETELVRERRARLKREILGEEGEGEGGGRTGVLVEQALSDVKARVELLLNHYNPSYVFSPLSAEDAFTLPERFEPIPLPEPQRRGRPAKEPSSDPSARNKRPRKSAGGAGGSNGALGRYDDGESKRARTRLGRAQGEHEYHPARPSGLAHELRPDEMDSEHAQALRHGHGQHHRWSRSGSEDAEVRGELGGGAGADTGDPSLAQAEADFHREQMAAGFAGHGGGGQGGGGGGGGGHDDVHDDERGEELEGMGSSFGQYLASDRGPRPMGDVEMFGAGVN